MTMTAATPVESLAQLELARRLVAEQFDLDEPLTRAALDLIDCATEVVHQLPCQDLASAREALGSARAAVISAAYAVRLISDLPRTVQT